IFVHLFVEEAALPSRPDLTPVTQRQIPIPSHQELQPYVSVTLNTEANPADIQLAGTEQLQRLSEVSNGGAWEITPSTAQDITLQPILHVEYHDISNNPVPGYSFDMKIGDSLIIFATQPDLVDQVVAVVKQTGTLLIITMMGLIILGVGIRFPVNITLAHTSVK